MDPATTPTTTDALAALRAGLKSQWMRSLPPRTGRGIRLAPRCFPLRKAG